MPPGLVRKLVIIAAADGLILQAIQGNTNSQRHQNNVGNGSTVESSSLSSSAVRIDYKTNKITSGSLPIASAASIDESEQEEDVHLEAYGIVGEIHILWEQ